MSNHEADRPAALARSPRGELERGRASYERGAWADAFRQLARADEAGLLGADDLHRLGMSAGVLGRDEDMLEALERAYRAHLAAGEHARAARSAVWLGFRLFVREAGRANGWFVRAQRLLERAGGECAEQGYLRLATARRQLVSGEWEAARECGAEAEQIGERFRDPDLVALARNLQGQALLRVGRVQEGLAFLDETMVAVTSEELSPLVTGIVYCSVIHCCQQIYALGRAREWTSALTAWCERQPEVVFAGNCQVYRAEVLQLHGDWPDAIAEARRASERLSETDDPSAAAALYQEAEVHRLRGEFDLAEEAYRGASRRGLEPQPGLALLRLAQGRTDAAEAQLRRVLTAAADRLQRTRLLPAWIEILLAAGHVEEARGACRELEAIAGILDTEVVRAMAEQAQGALALAEGDARNAVGALRRSLEVWQRVEAPYIAARLRVLVGRACRALGDEEGARLELDAARAVFERLGAAPELERVAALTRSGTPARPHGLTRRELEVLLLVAAGKTNRAIAAQLYLSEKTVDRHVSNIFAKLNVPSRAAATAFAYEHRLL